MGRYLSLVDSVVESGSMTVGPGYSEDTSKCVTPVSECVGSDGNTYEWDPCVRSGWTDYAVVDLSGMSTDWSDCVSICVWYLDWDSKG